MLNKKYSVNRIFLVLLWFVLFLARILIGGLCLLDLILFFMRYPLLFPIHQSNITNLILIFLVVIVVWIIWRKTTYSKSDFLKLSKSTDIIFSKSHLFPKAYSDLSHTYFRGSLNDIVVAAVIDYPSNTFFSAAYSVGGSMGRYEELEKQLFH